MADPSGRMYHQDSSPPVQTQQSYSNNIYSPLQQTHQQGLRHHHHYNSQSPTVVPQTPTTTPTTATSSVMPSPTYFSGGQRTPIMTSMSSSAATPGSSSSSRSVITARTPREQVERAKEQWSNHGDGVSQASEERRRKLSQQGHIVVRITSAESRVDATGNPYTAYRVSYRTPGQQPSSPQTTNVVEHRYSEFRQLQDLLQSHGVCLKTTFPTKQYNWSSLKNSTGLGNWISTNNSNSPTNANVSATGSSRDEKTVTYRKTQLDLWLLELCEMYNLSQLPSALRIPVGNFFTQMNRPPCDQEVMDLERMGVLDKSNPVTFTMASSIRQATSMFQSMRHEIPLDLLRHAKALCFLTVAKAGFVMSGRIGTGLIVAAKQTQSSHPQSQTYWSAPSALGTVGIGYGALAGGDITNYIIVLTTAQAVTAFCEPSSIRLGAEVGIALGPSSLTPPALSTHQKNWTLHSAYCYGQSRAGFFVGISLEGSLISPRHDVNAKFYNLPQVTPAEILLGSTVPPPHASRPLYDVLDQTIH